jgi:hypothetical protein
MHFVVVESSAGGSVASTARLRPDGRRPARPTGRRLPLVSAIAVRAVQALYRSPADLQSRGTSLVPHSDELRPNRDKL